MSTFIKLFTSATMAIMVMMLLPLHSEARNHKHRQFANHNNFNRAYVPVGYRNNRGWNDCDRRGNRGWKNDRRWINQSAWYNGNNNGWRNSRWRGRHDNGLHRGWNKNSWRNSNDWCDYRGRSFAQRLGRWF